MIIQTLRLRNYRSFVEQNFLFNPNLNIIVGANGQGKTNILEAIHVLTEGDSFRFAKNENLILLGEKHGYIGVTAINKDLEYNLESRLSFSKKELLLNQKPISINTLNTKIGKFSSVLFSPESLSVVKESSDERRQIVDQLLSQITINGASVLSDFKKVLKTRNRLLKDISENKIDYQMGLDTLHGLNSIFLKNATELTYSRLQCLNEIRDLVEQKLIEIHSGKNIQFAFEYIISEKNHVASTKDFIAETLKNRQCELERAEIASGVSLVGPQKHDVKFIYNGNDSRFYCSQGQQRSIILAYKMAQIVYHHRVNGFYPLLLLDDVLSELDLMKQESLISTLNQNETQTFITTTDISLLSKLSMTKASVYEFKNGKIFC